MKAIKTSELIGPALDWAVAKCEGLDVSVTPSLSGGWNCVTDGFKPSTNWSQGGPILDREGISSLRDSDDKSWGAYVAAWKSRGMSNRTKWRFGPTQLVAAMRAYVASKLGDEIEIPEELLC